MNSTFLFLLIVLVPPTTSWQLRRLTTPDPILEHCEEHLIAKCRRLMKFVINQQPTQKCTDCCKPELTSAVQEVKANGKCTEETGNDLHLCIRGMESPYRSRNYPC